MKFPCSFVRIVAALVGLGSAVSAGLTQSLTNLNLGFEKGTLEGWTAKGAAFVGQPVKGDTVSSRRSNMKSGHEGDYWIGTFEDAGDEVVGELVSRPLKVTQPYGSFLVGGGSGKGTRVEFLDAKSKKVLFSSSGNNSEEMRPVVVDLKEHQGKEVFVRVVDEATGPWGHINFDQFRLHAARPKFDNEFVPARIDVSEFVPPVDEVLFDGISADKAAEVATLPEGFRMHVFASEPEVRQPIAFCLDDRGRLWVAEGFDYPTRAPEGQGSDRILILEDTDGDHEFDRRTVFMENLNLISGMEVGFGGVWVGAAPYLMFIPDRNGDDVPDSEPEIKLDGWDFLRDTHETLNTFIWGPDGWLYGCHGVFCPSHVGKPGTPQEERQRVDAAVWRYHPTKERFEVFAEGTSNPWGVDFDEFGQCIIEACVIPHLWHMIQGARYQRQGGRHYSISAEETARNKPFLAKGNPHYLNPFIYEDIKTIGDHLHYAGNRGPHAGNNRSDASGGGHAHAGLMMYLGGSWPAEYRNKAFMNNIHGQRLNMDVLERRGSGYVGTHGADFLNFNDRWSQVLNMRYDQNGSVYVIDWYDKNQCHHRREDGHDRGNGRIFKVVYDKEKWTPINLASEDDMTLAKLQSHDNDWMVRHSRRLLQERAASGTVNREAIGELNEILTYNPSVPKKLRAMWALHVTGNFPDSLGDQLLSSPEPMIRSWAIQLLSEEKKFSEEILYRLEQMATSDPSQTVRLYIASAMQRMSVDDRVPVLAALLEREEDITDHNLPLMYWYAAEPVVAQRHAQGIQLLQDCKIPKIREFIVRRLAAFAR